jgi:hypothetical protein
VRDSTADSASDFGPAEVARASATLNPPPPFTRPRRSGDAWDFRHTEVVSGSGGDEVPDFGLAEVHA